MSSFDHHLIDTIHMDDRDKRRLVEELNTRQTNFKGPPRGVRVAYTAASVSVSITNPGGNVVNYSVIPRNLSRRGIAFLHGRFVYPDYRCNVTLRTLDGEQMMVEGTIVRCDHLGGTIHEVAAKFTAPIDLTLFAKMMPAELAAHTEEYDRDVANGEIEQGPLELGTILILDSYRADRKLCRALLEQEGYLCHEAANPQDAMSLAQADDLDMAIVDVCCRMPYGLEVIGQLRGGYMPRPILAISADDDEATREAALGAGAAVFLAKPLHIETFKEQVNLLLGNHGHQGDTFEPIFSSLGQDEKLKPLLREFVNEIRETVSTIKSAQRVQDLDYLRLVCRQLKGAGGSYGYDDITYMANEGDHGFRHGEG